MIELSVEQKLPLACESAPSSASKTLATVIAFNVVVAIAVYLSTLKIGFLLDDYFHINYLYACLHGHPEELWCRFTGNWAAGSNGPPLYALDCYRPAVSLTLFTDYLFYGVHAWGYHLTNLLMFG